MKISEAIEIKENHQRLHLDEYYQELLEADKLSIEGLKAIQRHRHDNLPAAHLVLKGETPEEEPKRRLKNDRARTNL